MGILISSYPCGQSKSVWSSIRGGNFDVILPSWTFQSLFEVPWRWEFWYHLALVHVPRQFEVPWGWKNFDITLPFCTIEITLPLWTLRVNWSSMAVGILISSYPCGQSKSVWCSMVVRILISSCPCAHSLQGGGTFEIILEFWYHLTLVDSRSVSISSSMGVIIVWGNCSCTVAQSGDRSCASRVAQA